MVTYSLVKTAADEPGDRQLAREALWLRALLLEEPDPETLGLDAGQGLRKEKK